MAWTTERKTSSDLRGQRVLVVDDEAIIALDVEATVTSAGAEVIGPSSSLESAMALASGAHPTLAVLDVRLGRETVDPLAQLLTEGGVPLLFYSGQIGCDEIRRDWPSCAFLAKPASPAVLIEAIKALLERPGGSAPQPRSAGAPALF